MPIYEYGAEKGKGCAKCRGGFEVMQAIGEKPLTACPNCGGRVCKLISKIGRIEVAYTPSDAFKHYTRRMEERERNQQGKTDDE